MRDCIFPPGLLASGTSALPDVILRQIEWAREDPLTFVISVGAWACGFAATFVFFRMIFTHWGDTRVTQKTLTLSMLVHLAAGLLSTNVILRGSALPNPGLGRGPGTGERRIPIHSVLGNGGDASAAGESATGTPVWDRPAQFAHAAPARMEKPVEEPPAVELPVKTEVIARTPVLAEIAPVPVQTETTPAVPEPARRTDEVPASVSPAPMATTDIAGGEARPEVRPGARIVRDARGDTSIPRVEVPRAARTIPPDDEPTTAPAPREVASLPAAPTQPSPVRPVEDDSATVRSTKAPAAPSVGDFNARSTTAAVQPEPSATAAGPFSRSGRRIAGDLAAATSIPERIRPEQPSGRQMGTEKDPLQWDAAIPRRGSENLPPGFTPSILRPEAGDGGGGAAFIGKGREQVPAQYRLRNAPQRGRIAREMGATDASEQAVAASLEWLARHQHPDGYWPPIEAVLGRDPGPVVDFNDPAERQQSGLTSESGLTALAVLAFLGAGHTHELGPYADNVDRALRWLVARQQANGYLGVSANKYAHMYCHGMATIALGEAYGMTKDQKLRAPLARAVQYTIYTQNQRDGGWRYIKDDAQFGDMSIFGWQLMALKSAQTAGIDVPAEALDRCVDFLIDHGEAMKKSRLSQYGGLASYRKYTIKGSPLPQIEAPKPSMTAEALFCRQLLGIKRTNPASVEAATYLAKNLPKRSEQDLYYWYYGTLAMKNYDGEPWQQWNEALLEQLISDQRTDGKFAGSWNPRRPWGDYGGRVFSTALSTLCLEVYYRFLPLYQSGGAIEERAGK